MQNNLRAVQYFLDFAELPVHWFIRLCQNTLQLVGALRKSRLSGAAGMTRGASACAARWRAEPRRSPLGRRRVSFGAISL
jgi:hypothetical protein